MVNCIRLLAIVALADATFDIKNDEQFQTFKETEFGNEMLQDVVENHITGLYSDLKTILGDFESFQELSTFRRRALDGNTATFRYELEAPMYHLKQKHTFPLPSGTIELKLTKTSGDCTGIRLDRVGNMEWRSENVLVISSSGSRGSLWIPDHCALYINWIQRRVLVDNMTCKQLRFSYRNNQHPQLRGMYSTEFVNFNRYNYCTSVYLLQRLPVLRMQSYIDRIATFEVDVSHLGLVVPQNHDFLLYLSSPLAFQSDTLRLIVRPSNCPAAESFDQEGLTVTESSLGELEFQVKKHQVEQNVRIKTPPGCELILRRISRQVSIERDRIAPQTRKQIEFGFSRGECVPDIGLTSNTIHFVRSHHYVETLADLPSLQFSFYLLGRARFETKHLDLYIVPSDTFFQLHLVEEEGRGRFKRDQITFSIHRKPNCEIIPSIEDTRGLTIQSSSQDLFKIIINRYELNRNNEIGTQVTVRSNCDLKFQRIIRTFWALLYSDERASTASIELDSTHIDTL